jgi:hypothetical protein
MIEKENRMATIAIVGRPSCFLSLSYNNNGGHPVFFLCHTIAMVAILFSATIASA